jgi:hypothetical protein
LALAAHTRAAQVERAGAARRATTPPDTEDGRSLADADADAMDVDDDEPDPAPKPIRKRREKKVIPMGQNGLAKRRVVKTRTTTDAKGFMGALRCAACFAFSVVCGSREARSHGGLLRVRIRGRGGRAGAR